MADNKEAKKPAAKKPAAPKAEAKKAAPKAEKKSGKTIKLTQIASPAGRFKYQRATLIGLGLNKMHRKSELEDTPAVRGMIKAVSHLVKIDDAA